MRMRTVVVGVVLAAVVALLGWRAVEVVRSRQAQAVPAGPARSRPVAVRAVPAAHGTIAARAAFTGEAAPRARVDVVPRIGGVVAAITVQEGDTVRRGQVVARLDPKDLRFQVEQARAATRTQRVQVEQARVTLATQEARLAQLQAGAPAEQIRQAEEQVRQARASLEFSREQLRRAEELYAQGFVSGQAVESARLDVVLQETRLTSAEEQFALLRRGPRPEEVEVARRQVEQAQVALRQAQSQLAQVEVTLRQAQSLLAESAIAAPASGTVGRRLVDVGATVTPSTPILQLVDIDPMLITVPVAERELAFMRPGLDATVQVDAIRGRTFRGTVAAIGAVLATATRTADVRIEVSNTDRAIRPGMTARVEVLLATRTGVVTVPVDAVVEREGAPRIFVVRDGTAERRDVEVGINDGERIEIRRGVVVGELVVIAGQHSLRDGSAVLLPGPGSEQQRPTRPRPSPGGQGP